MSHPVSDAPAATAFPPLPEPPDILLPPLDWSDDPDEVNRQATDAQIEHDYYLETLYYQGEKTSW